jgi:hypothetical protein
MEAECSSETSVDFQRTTGIFNPEDRDLQQNIFSILIDIYAQRWEVEPRADRGLSAI